ncbi:hypothetical protein EP7_005256 [Isosphaeraceae bacterium EP7]
MVHQTEAACLLQTGALYKHRIGLRSDEVADPVFAGFKAGAFSLYYGDAPIYHFDLDGRWQRAYVGATHYLKALDTSVQAIDRVRVGENLVLRRRTLPYAEAADLDASIRSAAIELAEAASSGEMRRLEPPPAAHSIDPETLRDTLDRIAGWDAAAWFAARERYLDTYGPLPFLPPDCQNALTLQATMGPSDEWGLGGGKRAASDSWREVRTRRQFADHIKAVSRLIGRREFQYRVLFLAGSDVLRLPIDDVAGYLEEAIARFPIGTEPGDEAVPGSHRFRGVHASLDEFSRPRPDARGFQRLAALGLRRVHLGIESGDRALRSNLGRSWSDDDLVALVVDLKRAGLGVSLVTLLGIGGLDASDRHVAATAGLISRVAVAGLGVGDLVSMVDAADLPGSAAATGVDVVTQEAEIRRLVGSAPGGSAVKLVKYNPEKQWR